MTLDYLPHVILELTSACNLHCSHCYNGWDKEACDTTFSFQKAFQLLDYLIRRTTVEDIIFTGGEPTLCEHFVELVMHALIHEKRVTIITNGNGPEEVYHQLAGLKNCRMQFSIHAANPQIHDHMTGVDGSWYKAVTTLHEMQKKAMPIVPVMVITRLNWDCVIETLHFYHSLHLDRILVNRYNLAARRHKISASAQQLRSAFQQMNLLAERLKMKISSGVCTPYCLLNPKDYPHIGFGSCSDRVYRRPITLDMEGNLRLCNHSPMVAGNMYRQSLSEIFSSDYVLEWNECEIPFCDRCSALQECRGGCRAASEQMGFTLAHEDPIIQELNLFL